ncbi:hypothetical protein OC842_003676 [Tilletia horrida]|uniref:Proteasome assembly chaperone 2 n=1 Tax=Tilletia horrida TaxID=155126 RepID=A0AAN6GB89_9BASI|nr:hypothetical protein OC842_003676 [Tilletia horrida]
MSPSPLALFPPSKDGAFASHVLVVPAISVGSVPQLTADLLVHHAPLSLRYVGAFDSTEWCLPYACPPDHVGGVPGSAEQATIGLPLQLYSNSNARLTVLQQRSPVLKSAKRDFVAALTRWARAAGFTALLILSSLDAALRVDSEMHIPLVHLLADTSSSSSSPLLKLLSQSFPAFQPKPIPATISSSSSSSPPTALPVLPSAGATRLLLQAAASANLPAGTLLIFASEGDNRGDAHAMATMVLDLLKRAQDSADSGAGAGAGRVFEREGAFKEPRSWLTVFGQRMDQAIYG